MRYIKILGLISILAVLAACSSPNPNCHNRGGQCWELSISGAGMNIAVGEEKRISLYVTVYQNGERSNLPRLSVSPDDVTFRVSNPNVLGLEIREDASGRKQAYIIGLAPGRSNLGAIHRTNREARAEIIIDVVR